MEKVKSGIIDRIEEILISVLLGAATLLVFAQVVARYVFNAGITWAPELVQHFFLWTVMIGASYGFKHGVHLGVDVLMKKLPEVQRRIMALVAVVISLGFTGLLGLSLFLLCPRRIQDGTHDGGPGNSPVDTASRSAHRVYPDINPVGAGLFLGVYGPNDQCFHKR